MNNPCARWRWLCLALFLVAIGLGFCCWRHCQTPEQTTLATTVVDDDDEEEEEEEEDGELPSKWDWRETAGALPPVGGQGDVLSCIAWSTSYATDFYLKKYVRTGWDLSDPAERLGPAYLYNLVLQVDAGSALGALVYTDADTYFVDSFEVLTEFGVSTAAQMPYTITYNRHPVEAAMTEAAALRQDLHCVTENWDLVFYPEADNWIPVKDHIFRIGPVLFLVDVHEDFVSCGVGKDYTGPAIGSAPAGQHSLLCVGYDDNHVRDSDNTIVPSFVFMNSWGPSWGDGGFVWIPYEKIRQVATGMVREMWMTPKPTVPCAAPGTAAIDFPEEWSDKPSAALWAAEIYDECGAGYPVLAATDAPDDISLPGTEADLLIHSPAVPLTPTRVAGSIRFVDLTPGGPGQPASYTLTGVGANRKRVGAWQKSAVLHIVDRAAAPKTIQIRAEVLDGKKEVTRTRLVTVHVKKQ